MIVRVHRAHPAPPVESVTITFAPGEIVAIRNQIGAMSNPGALHGLHQALWSAGIGSTVNTVTALNASKAGR